MKPLLLPLLLTTATLFSQDSRQVKIDSMVSLLGKEQSDTAKMRTLARIGSLLLASNPEQSAIYFQQLLELATTVEDPSSMNDALSGLGNSWYYRGDFTKARSFYAESSRIMKESGDSGRYALSMNNIGLTYINQGDLTKGLEFQLKSSATMERVKDERGLALNYNAIGVIYMELGKTHHNQSEIEKGLDYLKKSLSLCKKTNNQSISISVLNNIGNAYMELDQPDKAMEFMISSLNLSREMGNRSAEATALTNIATVFQHQELHKKANEYIEQALQIHRELNDKHGIANNLHALAESCLKAGDLKKANEYWKECRILLQETREDGVLAQVLLGLSKLAEKEGNFREAYALYKQHNELSDSLSNDEYARNLNEMKTRFDTETQIKENELLKTAAELDGAKLAGQQRTIIAISIGLLLLVILSFIIFKSYNDKKRANVLLEDQNAAISEQKKIIEEKNKDITDSIRYASRIQESILPSEEKRTSTMGEHFVFFRPRDIVSGDFFWTEQQDERVFVGVADCTGHGVPGALMSMIGNSTLNEIIRTEKNISTGNVLDLLRERIISTLEQKELSSQKDGMDIVLFSIDRKTKQLQYSGANNPLWICRKAEIIEIAPDKMPVGIHTGTLQPFKSTNFQLHSNDMIYAFTDGFADQFGGPSGKKYKYKKLQELLIGLTAFNMPLQQEKLGTEFDSWKGNLEQVDDVLIVGVRI